MFGAFNSGFSLSQRTTGTSKPPIGIPANALASRNGDILTDKSKSEILTAKAS